MVDDVTHKTYNMLHANEPHAYRGPSQGEYTGGAAPYGYALAVDGVALVEVATEQAVIAEARAFRGAGLSLRKVAEGLDRKGLRTRNGRTFAPAQVARMVAG
jgi:hypothetical protein